jgi:hypothetical protein
VSEISNRHYRCGTDNPDRARGWIKVINLTLAFVVYRTPREAIVCLLPDEKIIADDFFRSFKWEHYQWSPDTREHLEAVRRLLCDEFDLPAA